MIHCVFVCLGISATHSLPRAFSDTLSGSVVSFFHPPIETPPENTGASPGTAL